MRPRTEFKCLHCKEVRWCDPRKRGRQRYCAEPECRRASKAASQRRWMRRPENRDYFRGKANCERVREWRLANPGYWRRKGSGGKTALQDLVKSQSVEGQRIESKEARNALQEQPHALQEMCLSQPALLVGLIAVMTGHTLQDEIARSARSLLSRGRDILGMVPGGSEPMNHENQTDCMPGTFAAGASSI
jgi:hypothetical protein